MESYFMNALLCVSLQLSLFLCLVIVAVESTSDHYQFVNEEAKKENINNVLESDFEGKYYSLIRHLFNDALSNDNVACLTFKFTDANKNILQNYVTGNTKVSHQIISSVIEESLISSYCNASDFSFNLPYLSIQDICFYTSVVLGMFIFVLILFKTNVKFFGFIAFIIAIIAQKAYKRYISLMTNKMLLLSKYPDMPEECKSNDQVSYFTSLKFSFKKFFTGRDTCKEYFDKLNEHPVLDINLAYILYDVIFDPFLYASQAMGEGMGLFYQSTSKYMNFFYIIIFLIAISICCTLFIGYGYSRCITKSKNRHKRRNNQKHLTKPVEMKKIES